LQLKSRRLFHHRRPGVAAVASTPVETPEKETVEAAGAFETNAEHPADGATEETKQEQTETTTEKEDDGLTQTPPDQLEQAAGDFPVLAVGTLLHERYEVTQVISESAGEHIYSVTDHQGYQHCWNCKTEQNSGGRRVLYRLRRRIVECRLHDARIHHF